MAWGQKEEGDLPTTVRPAGSGSVNPGAKGALSFIGGEVTVTGNILGQGDLHLDGGIDGDIQCATLILGQGGRVKGNVTADKATISGTVNGTVNAKTLIVEKSAKIKGDLTYENLTVESGANVEGKLARRNGDKAPARTPPAVAEQPLKLVAENE